MSVTTRYFRGRAFTVPDAYSDVDDSGGLIQPPIGVLYPLIIGESQGGVPDTVLKFSSPQSASNVLRSGPLLDAVKRAFMPFQANAPEAGQSPYFVYAIRLGDGTPLNGPHQANLVLRDSAPSVNEVQTATFSATPTAGTFTVAFGAEATAPLAFNATAAAVQTALTGLATVGAGNVLVTGDSTAGYVFTFQGFLGGQDVAMLVVNPTGITTPAGVTATVVETTKGVEAGKPVISMTSVDWGAYTNGYRITVDTPASTNPNKFGYQVTFARSTSPGLPAQSETFDNIGRYGIEITYLGTGTACALTTNDTALTTLVTGGLLTDNLNIPYAQYPTIQEVVDQINLHPNYSAEVGDIYGDRPANQQDWLVGVDIAAPMTVTYTGTGTPARLAVETSETGNVIMTDITGAVADNFNYPLNEFAYPDVASLVQAITGDAVGVHSNITHATTYTGNNYIVVLKDAFAVMPVTNIQLTQVVFTHDDTEPEAGDFINILTPLTPTVAIAFSTTANLQAVVDHLNEFYSTLFSATKLASSALPLETSPVPHFFSGGEDVVNNRSGWLKALQTAALADVQIVVPLTPDPYIHNAVKVHCAIMSDPTNQRERVAIVGGASGESILDAQNRATNLGILADGDLIQVVYPGIIDVDFADNPVVVPPYMFAAQMAGMTCALGIGKSKTNKYIRAVGVEQKLTRAQIADLITSGVTTLEFLDSSSFRSGIRVSKDISTWLTSPNYIKHLFATKIASQAVSRIVRERCQPLIGQPNDKNFEIRLKNRIATTLDNLTNMGVLVAGQNKPAWRNIVINRDTDTVRVDFEATIVTEVDFIFITLHLDVFSAADTTGSL